MWPFSVIVFHLFGCHFYHIFRTLRLSVQEELMLVSSPETLHDDIVGPAPFSVHADFYPLCMHCLFPVSGCILTSLIGIEDFGAAPAFQRHVSGIKAQPYIHMRPHAPAQHKAAIPIHHDTKIVVATVYLNVGDITGPY